MEVYLRRIDNSRSEIQDEKSVKISRSKIKDIINRLSIKKSNLG